MGENIHLEKLSAFNLCFDKDADVILHPPGRGREWLFPRLDHRDPRCMLLRGGQGSTQLPGAPSQGAGPTLHTHWDRDTPGNTQVLLQHPSHRVDRACLPLANRTSGGNSKYPYMNMLNHRVQNLYGFLFIYYYFYIF